ncbi:MAG: class I SAM-dependent methyltransferase [Myxococcales bacterium]|nr:class I SAM-dependent methyltransferase [Myxococcales bacterium]
MIVDPRDAMLERLVSDAGITSGMRVLDLGSGHGRVTAMLSRIVGDEGYVVGVDRDPNAIAVARSNAARLGLRNVRFEMSELGALADASFENPFDGRFDAAVGRRVLMYVRDPIAALRAARAHVRSGGVFVVQEQDTSMVPVSSAPTPLHDKIHGWVWAMVQRENANPRFGLELPSLFEGAGLVLEDIRVEAVMQTAKRRLATAEMVRAVMPRIVAQGVATEDEIDIDTLDQRLERELVETGASFIGDVVYGAWGRC